MKSKKIYNVRNEKVFIAPEPVASTVDVELERQIAKTKLYWQTCATKSRRKMLSDGTMRNTGECMRSLKKKLHGIEFSDELGE